MRKRSKIEMKRGIGKSIHSPLRHKRENLLFPPANSGVRLFLLVVRQTGDTERYKLAEVPDLRFAADYRKRLAKVKVPARLSPTWHDKKAA